MSSNDVRQVEPDTHDAVVRRARDKVAGLRVVGPVPRTADSVPLSTAFLPGAPGSVPLADLGYVEEEYFVSGTADIWGYDDELVSVPVATDVEYTTRFLLRRPADPTKYSGALYLEAAHQRHDRGPTWDWLSPWLVDSGHAWVGVSHDHRSIESMKNYFDGERYASLNVPRYGLGWDIVGTVAGLLRSEREDNPLREFLPERAVLMGVSLTGSWTRTFVNGGYRQRAVRTDGTPVFDGYLIFISSGGPAAHGYLKIADDVPDLPYEDPRRVVRNAGVPVIEMQSEYEAETNGVCVRDDSDEPGDQYRMYHVAGTAHRAEGHGLLASVANFQLAGFGTGAHATEGIPSDGQMYYFGRAAAELLERWVADGVVPPRVSRFQVLPEESDALRGLTPEARPLLRDEDGNVVGGIRTPWVEVPVETYIPHSAPKEGSGPRIPWGTHMTAFSGAMRADMAARVEPLPRERIDELYTGPEDYLDRFDRHTQSLVEARLLRPAEAAILQDRARAKAARVWSAAPEVVGK